MDICHHSFGTIVKRTEVFTQGMERASSGEIPLQNKEIWTLIKMFRTKKKQ